MQVITLSNDDLLKVRAAAQFIENNLKYHTKIPNLSERFLINQDKLKKGFKYLFGSGPYAYLKDKRIMKAKILLIEDYTIRSIAITVGFTGDNAETNFIKSFKKTVGQSPAAWRKDYTRKTKFGENRSLQVGNG